MSHGAQCQAWLDYKLILSVRNYSLPSSARFVPLQVKLVKTPLAHRKTSLYFSYFLTPAPTAESGRRVHLLSEQTQKSALQWHRLTRSSCKSKISAHNKIISHLVPFDSRQQSLTSPNCPRQYHRAAAQKGAAVPACICLLELILLSQILHVKFCMLPFSATICMFSLTGDETV